MLEDVIKAWGGTEVSAMDVYSDMFSLGDNLIQRSGEPSGDFKTNPLGYWKNEKESHGHYRIMFDDTFEETLKQLQKADFTLMNGITYFGRQNLLSNASKMYAMIFDLDDVTDETLGNFFSGAFNSEVYPIPNYVALSGHGVHLYYLFEQPVPLYPNIKLQLKEMKFALTEKMWNNYTSTNRKIQYQGINQGFRVIGGKTKIKGVRTKAFRVNTHPFNLTQLCEYVSPEHRVDETKLWRERNMSIQEARRKYPEWYQQRVVLGAPKGKWTCKRDLYDWWLRKVKSEASVGHRYFCVMCLAIYAAKCDIEYEELKKDAYSLIPLLNGLDTTNKFTKVDCDSALECYDQKYVTFPRNDMERLSGVAMPHTKRNGRSRATHIKIMNSTRDILYPNGEWRENSGRPTKQTMVINWRKKNPTGKKADCIKELGLSKPTVYRWWDEV
jgi:hypothetical protein